MKKLNIFLGKNRLGFSAKKSYVIPKLGTIGILNPIFIGLLPPRGA